MEQNTNDPLINLNVDDNAGNILKETTRWTKFISIVGIIGVALLLVSLIFAGSVITALSSRIMSGFEALAGVLMFFIVVILAIVGFMVYLLYRFSTLVRKGIETQDQGIFNSGFNVLKIYFIISRVFAICSLLINFSSLFKL
ncbi:MAG TPA: hypothetical protein VMT76_17215 [Puia sp.]|nr:hypothetical protein [Puia sp.]